jgi:type II secretory pathway predicted ATPase ExeA/cell division septation protein DedD
LLTYELYYGLKEKPFSLSVDPRFLYKSRSHAPVFDDLLAGIRRREGLIVLTGDIGTGKTTLCRAVLGNLDRKTFSTFVPDPFVSREDLLKMLLIDFGVMSVDDLQSGRLNGASRPDLSYPLYEFLKSLVPLQAFAVLVIDEAQNLSVPLLEEIRILSDLEAPEKLLQVVLVGQLELRAKLKLPEMRQVDQRVSVRCGLEPLNQEAVAGYIAHRLAVAGGGIDRVAFLPEAVDLIFRTSKGVPRLINLVCDRALHRGHLARMPEIDAGIVRVAVVDLGLADARLPEPPAFPSSELDVTPTSPTSAPTSQQISFPSSTAASAADDERPLTLLVESRTRRLTAVLIVLLLAAAVIAGVSYWQSLQDELNAPIAQPPLPPGPDVGVPSRPAFVAAPMSDAVPFNSGQAAAPAIPGALVGPAVPAASVPAAPTATAGAAAPTASGSAAAPSAARLFAVDVALFNSRSRADRLVSELTAAGFHAYQNDLDLGDRGHLREVLVGIYATREAAEADAVKIRAMPGYQDAQVIAGP